MSSEAILIAGITALAATVASLFALFMALGKWAKSNVVEPLISNHLALIETLKDSIPKHAEKLSEIAETSKKIEASAQEEVSRLGSIEGKMDDTAKELQEHRKWTEEALKFFKEKEG